MSANLFSPYWYRVSKLRLTLKSHISIHRQLNRNKVSYLLHDNIHNKNFNLDVNAYKIAALLNGQKTIDEIWSLAHEQFPDHAPTQDELIALINFLYSNDLVSTTNQVNLNELVSRHEKQKKAKVQQTVSSPLSLKLPLHNPNLWLERTQHWFCPLFTWSFFGLWCTLVLLAIILACLNWSSLVTTFNTQALQPSNLLLLWLLYPLIKVAHEFGHAYATRHYGGDVNEAGIILLALIPFPYVDASASWLFCERRYRIIVAAGGMIVELFFAALALILWTMIEDGIIRTLCFNIVIIGSISTLLFNGNPLLKYDGYYIFSDLIAIPNLSKRSNKYFFSKIKHWLFNIEPKNDGLIEPSEAKWLFGYAVLSFIYRLVILWVIFIYISNYFFYLAVGILCWVMSTQYIYPLSKNFKRFLNSTELEGKQTLVIKSCSAIGLLSALLFFFTPLPTYTTVKGIVWLPEQSIVRARADGFVSNIHIKSHEIAEPQQKLITLENSLLPTELAVLAAKRESLALERDAYWQDNKIRAQQISDELVNINHEYQTISDKIAELSIRSKTQGKIIIPDETDLLGKYVSQGDVLGYLIGGTKPTVLAAVDQYHIGLMKQNIIGVEVRSSTNLNKIIRGSIDRAVPEATKQLPSPALGKNGGGDVIVTDYAEDGMTASMPVFIYEINLQGNHPDLFLGAHAQVRFYHGTQSLGARLYRNVRQLFMRRLNI